VCVCPGAPALSLWTKRHEDRCASPAGLKKSVYVCVCVQVHLRYFCGPNAMKTDAQALQAKKKTPRAGSTAEQVGGWVGEGGDCCKTNTEEQEVCCIEECCVQALQVL